MLHAQEHSGSFVPLFLEISLDFNSSLPFDSSYQRTRTHTADMKLHEPSFCPLTQPIYIPLQIHISSSQHALRLFRIFCKTEHITLWHFLQVINTEINNCSPMTDHSDTPQIISFQLEKYPLISILYFMLIKQWAAHAHLYLTA